MSTLASATFAHPPAAQTAGLDAVRHEMFGEQIAGMLNEAALAFMRRRSYCECLRITALCRSAAMKNARSMAVSSPHRAEIWKTWSPGKSSERTFICG